MRNFPLYLGGWPSANFFAADQGQLVLSSLLYSGQVVAKDPISDWFAIERYQKERHLASRPGFLDREGRPNVAETRRFLAFVVPALQELRPLIEAGALVLVPSERFFAQHDATIEELRARLLQRSGKIRTTSPADSLRRNSPLMTAFEDCSFSPVATRRNNFAGRWTAPFSISPANGSWRRAAVLNTRHRGPTSSTSANEGSTRC